MRRATGWLACAAVLAAGFVGASTLPTAASERKPKDVTTMNLDLLEENLLKIWIVEESSERYNQANIAQKSFEGLIPVEPTGDPELDAKNRDEQNRLNFELTHFIKLELDGAIQVIDICRRALGKQPRLDVKALERKRFLQRDVPNISWRWMKLEDALQDLGAKLGIRVELAGVPERTKLEVNLTLEGATVEQLIDFLLQQHFMEWTYADKVLRFQYKGDEDF
jgi:hypothetical protein